MDNEGKDWRKPPAWKLEDEIRENVKDRIRDKMADRARRRSCHDGGGYGAMIPGAILLALGLIFLLDSLGWVSAHYFFQFWPMILIFIGVANLARQQSRFWGVMFLLFGTILQLNELGIGHFGWGQLWPLLLIAAGAMAMWSALQARCIIGRSSQQSSDPQTTLNESAVFGSVEKRLNTKEFRGGQLQALFGGIEIDLRDADIDVPGVVLHANAIFGGIEIRVPDTWFVAARGQGVFGGFSDATRYNNPPTDPDKPKKTLIVHGTALFGGVEIRN